MRGMIINVIILLNKIYFIQAVIEYSASLYGNQEELWLKEFQTLEFETSIILSNYIKNSWQQLKL